METLPYELRESATAENFLDLIRPSNAVWGPEWESQWVFRGHADANWLLLPRILRPEGHRRLQPVIAIHAKNFGGWSFDDFGVLFKDELKLRTDERCRMGVMRILADAERYSVRNFAELADELGLEIDPQEKWRIPGFEGPCLATALAQHHGIPTFLLDWTRKPLVAAFFAAAGNTEASHIAVWALNAGRVCDPPGIVVRSIQMFQCPRSLHGYLHAQGGVFTWTEQKRLWNYLLSAGRWPTVPDILACEYKPPEPALLKKITLPRTEVPRLRHLLWRERLSRAHLMPTLDNVCESLVARWAVELGQEQGQNLPAPVVWTRPPGPNPLTG